MSIAIYTLNQKESQAWEHVLAEALPNVTIEVYPQISNFKEVEFLVCWKPERGILTRFPNLKAIQSLGAGVDHIFDVHEIISNIQVSKVVDHQLAHDMWEYGLTAVLADMKNLTFHSKNQTATIWKPRRYKSIKDISVGILGLGTIGKYVAENFSNLNFETFGWSASKKEIVGVQTYIGQRGLTNLLNHVDYVLNILPLTVQTRGIINIDFLQKMKPEAMLINIGRGGHLVEEDLLIALQNGVIRRAVLDVFEKEPLPLDHRFWKHDKITITPHIASLTDISSVWPQVVENFRRMSEGRDLQYRVDNARGY